MTGMTTFRTTVELGGKTATGLPVPDEVVQGLDAGKRPAVEVTINGYSYRTTIATMSGRFLIPLSAQNRTAAGVAAGDEVDVTIRADTAPREVALSDDLMAALAHDPPAQEFFNSLAHSHRKEWARWIDDAKRPDTRTKRLQVTVEALRSGQKRH